MGAVALVTKWLSDDLRAGVRRGHTLVLHLSAQPGILLLRLRNLSCPTYYLEDAFITS